MTPQLRLTDTFSVNHNQYTLEQIHLQPRWEGDKLHFPKGKANLGLPSVSLLLPSFFPGPQICRFKRYCCFVVTSNSDLTGVCCHIYHSLVTDFFFSLHYPGCSYTSGLGLDICHQAVPTFVLFKNKSKVPWDTHEEQQATVSLRHCWPRCAGNCPAHPLDLCPRGFWQTQYLLPQLLFHVISSWRSWKGISWGLPWHLKALHPLVSDLSTHLKSRPMSFLEEVTIPVTSPRGSFWVGNPEKLQSRETA